MRQRARLQPHPPTTTGNIGTSNLTGKRFYHESSCRLTKGVAIMFSMQNDVLIIRTPLVRYVQIAHIGYHERLALALTRHSAEIARIIADRPLELDEARRLAVRMGLVQIN